MAGRANIARVVERLRERLGERLVTSEAVRMAHGRGEAFNAVAAPDAVLFAETTDEVAFALRACSEERVPVIPYGAGTSLEGQLQAVEGGISIDLGRMNRILAVNCADLDCQVEAGVTREALNLELRHEGLFFPLDPGANATLGGMAATRASGTNAVRYGTMRDVVLGLTLVTPRGIVIRTGGRARKSAAGYDLTRLYIGSEGTLGIITELWLRLFGIPEQVASGYCQFESLGSAVEAVTTILRMGIPVARIELLDAVQTGACIAYSRLDGLLPVNSLFLEFHGSRASVAEQVGQAAAIVAECGGSEFRWAEASEDRNRLWKARHDAFWAGRSLAPGFECIVTDACVPLSALRECIETTRARADSSGLVCTIVGHVGDGNFHAMILFDPQSRGQRSKAEALALDVARRAIACGGTSTGEHGIGLHKLGLLADEHGPAVDIMRAVKSALDPANIMNPGKTVPPGPRD